MDRLEQLAQALAADEAKAKELFELSAEEAAAKLAEDGYDFTVEELKAFGEKLVKLTSGAEEELDADALDEVSGGGLLKWIWDICAPARNKSERDFQNMNVWKTL